MPRQLEAGIRRLELGPPAEPERRDKLNNVKQGLKELKLVDLFFKVMEDRWVNSPM